MRKSIRGSSAVFATAIGAAALMAVTATDARADWPERPITVVVMYGAGGGTDTVLRTLVGEMTKSTGWKINVINKPGAVGGVATKFVAGKKADGYTLLGAANYNKYASVMGHTETRAWKDWQYMQAANSLGSWSVRPDSKFKTFEDVIKAARANPGKVTISTSGTGGLWHELAAVVAVSAGVTLKYVPYKGGKPATLAGLPPADDRARSRTAHGAGLCEYHRRRRALRPIAQLGRLSRADLQTLAIGRDGLQRVHLQARRRDAAQLIVRGRQQPACGGAPGPSAQGLGAADQKADQPQEGLRGPGAQACGDPPSHVDHWRAVPLAGPRDSGGMSERTDCVDDGNEHEETT